VAAERGDVARAVYVVWRENQANKVHW
jgi:hypothetical protein